MSREIFINPSALMDEAKSYRDAADKVGGITFQYSMGVTRMPCITSYIDTLEAFRSFIGEFKDLSHRDAASLEWLRYEWGNFDETISRAFGGGGRGGGSAGGGRQRGRSFGNR